ncbi:hypothetical protein J27TS7_08350 [Paenibacillus dendritiformis]|uniref:MazG-like family protein n=1 Tax=Paenibacillus dendritiformis TaxID=130049 RepID=UPI001B0E07FF|nr:MazG-like family protein [Paenibacillus dendritiformis]GIO71321.1 hypothetical protein J27TS7_08350 [Paenibacillus dendritiformis]
MTITIEFSLPTGGPASPEITVTEEFQGGLRAAIRYGLKRYDMAVANFYSGDRWLKEIGWNRGQNTMLSNRMNEVLAAVAYERRRQDSKWGEQNHQPPLWIGILGEEFGELCEAINETVFDNGAEARKKGGYENMRAEAIQLAAVAVAFVEYLDRHYEREGEDDDN